MLMRYCRARSRAIMMSLLHIPISLCKASSPRMSSSLVPSMARKALSSDTAYCHCPCLMWQ